VSDPAAQMRWEDAHLAALLLAIDPVGLGGITLKGPAGPLRDQWYEYLRAALPDEAPLRRMPPGIEDDRLIGAVDLPATLKSGRPVLQRGLLVEADGGALVIPMAERLTLSVVARVAAALDRQEVVLEREGLARRIPTRLAVIAFDEGMGDDAQMPAMLFDRLAFPIDFSGLNQLMKLIDLPDMTAARARLSEVAAPSDAIIEVLVGTAAACGLASVTAPLLALRAARAAAALRGSRVVEAEDAEVAARLVLGPRALTAPSDREPAPADQQSQEDPPPQEPPQQPESGGDQQDQTPQPPEDGPSLEDLILAAAQAALPDGLLERLKQGGADRQPASRRVGRGKAENSPMRGRPAGVRQGALRPGSRLALVDTLRAAAPWQAVRKAQQGDDAARPLIQVRREDFRLKKYVQRRESTIIFCVDASGSAAFQRLAESKGAVELLLAEAYVKRTYAALVVFRGPGAEMSLPPTRSLSRAKKLLAELPGGGGTPLAAGIDMARTAAVSERAKGRDPLIVLLTDGRANIDRQGQPARPGATLDAVDAARQLAASKIAAVFVDTATRPREEGAAIAAAMGARYVALPYVEAGAVRDVVLAQKVGQ
jgi:magnesium chelatase subunit D